MHYIPFINEDKKNTYEVVNCKCCPLFKTKLLDDTCYMAYCNYSNGDVIYYDKESSVITLSGRRICPVKYKDPVEDFHYFQITCDISSKFVETCRKLEREEYKSDETEESLEKRLKDIMTCRNILEELFPEKEEMYYKLIKGKYKLDDDMNLYEI